MHTISYKNGISSTEKACPSGHLNLRCSPTRTGEEPSYLSISSPCSVTVYASNRVYP